MSSAARCVRGEECRDREPVYDPGAGEHTGWVGATYYTGEALCPVCCRDVDHALLHLPGDVTDLTRLMGRVSDGTVLETGRIKLSAPGPTLPIREHLEAVRALIVHETCTAAADLAASVALDWSRVVERHSRIGHRTQTACLLLRHRLTQFLDLGPVRYPARSVNVRRGDGHEDPTIAGGEIWTVRDGVTRALLLVRLHWQVWQLADRSEGVDRLQMPCRSCSWLELRHKPGEPDVWCAHCGHRSKWDDYDTLRSVFLDHSAA